MTGLIQTHFRSDSLLHLSGHIVLSHADFLMQQAIKTLEEEKN